MAVNPQALPLWSSIRKPALWSAGILGALALATGVVLSGSEAAPAPASIAAIPMAFPQSVPSESFQATVPIRSGDTLGKLLGSMELPTGAIRSAGLPHYDLAKLRAGRSLTFVWTDDSTQPSAVRYPIDADRTLVVERSGEEWVGALDEVTYTASETTREFTLTSSLWGDGRRAGLSPADLMTVARAFEYELDLNTELQPGAHVSLVAEELTADTPDARTKLGALHAVRIVNGEDTHLLIHHEHASGKEGWYRPDGRSAQKPFLRSPLAFDARVTSGFGRRFHPIKKRYRKHNGTDFGAPTGTKVRAVADGRVIMARHNGGHGKFIKLKHENGNMTSYSHLSRIQVKNGQRVKQGQTIGRVGSTGMSTGPHLHYQMWIGGRLVDPLKAKLPYSAPLPKAELQAFKARTATLLPKLPALGKDTQDKSGL